MHLSKKMLLFSAGIVSCIVFLMDFAEPYRLCGESWRKCMDVNYQIGVVLLPIVVLFFVTIILFFLRDEIYKSWIRFAIWWIPLSMILILISPEYSHDWMFPIEKGTVAMLTSAAFVVISIGIIVFALFKSRKS